MAYTLEQLNAATTDEAVAMLDGLYEHSPWIARQALASRPFRSLPQLQDALRRVLDEADAEAGLALIRAHPELAGRAMQDNSLTAESTHEQDKAGLTHCSPEELARLRQLNADYLARFGFPFILAVRSARHRPDARPDHRHLRTPAGQSARCRIPRGAAQHPPHRRDPPGRQVRPGSDTGQRHLGLA